MSGLPAPYRRLSGVPGGGIKRKRRDKSAEIAGSTLEIKDERVQEIVSRLSNSPADYKLAKRVATLMDTYPDGTIPELITLDYLEQQQIPYTYQAWIYGGRSRQGGVIPDFVLAPGGRGMAWLVQGDYWHTRAEVAESDVSDKLRLLGTMFHGVQIEQVIELWEQRIYKDRPEIFELAVMGIELGR